MWLGFMNELKFDHCMCSLCIDMNVVVAYVV